MRLGLFLLCVASVLLPGLGVAAHPDDEFAQVTLEVTIDEQAVEVIVAIPARTAKRDFLDGLSPVAMDQMEPEELAAVIGPILAAKCPVSIDGIVVPPTILEPVVEMSNSRQPARRFPEAQVLEQGTLRFAARYETKAAPGRVSLDWSVYANRYDEAGEPVVEDELLLVAALLRAEQQERYVFLSPVEPSFTWHSAKAAQLPADLLVSMPVRRNFLYVPLASIALVLAGLVCGGVTLRRSRPRAVGLVAFSLVSAAACLPYGRLALEHTSSVVAPDDEQALAVFESLHRNIYRAFDYTDEGAVYDALAQSVDGPMLETIYNDVYQSLIMREENGAVSKVVKVEIDQATRLPMDPAQQTRFGTSAYRVQCKWRVDGLVTHFGHTHARTNAFEAVYTVAPRADGWRIVEAAILNQQRVDDGQQAAQDLLHRTGREAGDETENTESP